ncbi:TRAP transporter substrate-binding protein [Blastococcus carthaginiensis]|uniref:TRAP transporter substrate-binding protein n=1 Tax=Blastococcus carthaginiensis TaxID=3050034 RepID=UPI0038734563
MTLRYAFFAPEESFPGQQMVKWAEELEQRTDGQVEVELFPGGTLLGAGDIYDGVSSGTVDVGLDLPSYDVGRFPVSSVISVPIGMENSQTASRVFLDLLTELEPEEFADYEIITAFTTEAGYLQTKERVASLDDLGGKSIRVPGSMNSLIQEMGATPVALPTSEVSEALATNVVEGYVTSRDQLEDLGMAEHIRYITDYPMGIAAGFVAVMDKDRFAELPEDVQEVIRDLRPEMSEWTATYHDEENIESSLAYALAEGVETVEVTDPEGWESAMESEADRWVAGHADAGFDPAAVLAKMRELAGETAE